MTEQYPTTERDQSKENSIEFEATPRIFTEADVRNVQTIFDNVRKLSIEDGRDYTINANLIYEGLTEGQTDSEHEPRADEHCFDHSMGKLLQIWGERRGMQGEAPSRLEDIRSTFVQYSGLNKESPIHFQGGAEYASSSFVHVATGRAMGKHREQSTTRYYLNPRADTMGVVVEELIDEALNSDVPLYFKYVDVATNHPTKRTLNREDRVVIYGSDAQKDFIETTLQKIYAANRDGFADRTVAGFGEELAEGVTRASDVTKEQNEKFKGHSEGTSFNDLRAQLIFEASLAVMKDILLTDASASSLVDNVSIRDRFHGSIYRNLAGSLYANVRTEYPNIINDAIAYDLSIEKMRDSRKFSHQAMAVVEDAIRKTARDVLPHIRAEDLLPGFNFNLQQLAPKYGVDATNLAKNIPIHQV